MRALLRLSSAAELWVTAAPTWLTAGTDCSMLRMDSGFDMMDCTAGLLIMFCIISCICCGDPPGSPGMPPNPCAQGCIQHPAVPAASAVLDRLTSAPAEQALLLGLSAPLGLTGLGKP